MENSSRKVIIYARFSTDMQNKNSTRDQIENCKAYAKAQGWTVVKCFEDAAKTGTNSRRPGYQQMRAAIQNGLVDIALAENLDRFCRNQEDSANLYKHCEYFDVELHTISDRRIEPIHIGMKGTMDAIHIKRIAEGTHRGLLGKVRDGLSAGGLSYGYRIPFDIAGSKMTGELEIHPEQAPIVVRIFTEFAAGKSPQAIASDLNTAGIPAPRHKPDKPRFWKQNTIYGNARRGTGILNNELYSGKRVWNRLEYRESPFTYKRVSRLRPASEQVVHSVPHLSIIDPALWLAVKDRQAKQKKTMNAGLATSTPVKLRRRKYLLSGLLECARCGGKLTVAGPDGRRAYYCANAKEKGPSVCQGMPGIRLDSLAQVVLGALPAELMQPDAVETFKINYEANIARMSKERDGEDSVLKSELLRQQQIIDGCMAAIRANVASPTLYAELEEAERRKTALTAERDEVTVQLPSIPNDLSKLYAEKIGKLEETLSNPEIVHRASESLAELIDRIVVEHDSELGHTVEIFGNIVGLLGLADSKKAASYKAAACSLKMVAGVGFEPTTFRL